MKVKVEWQWLVSEQLFCMTSVLCIFFLALALNAHSEVPPWIMSGSPSCSDLGQMQWSSWEADKVWADWDLLGFLSVHSSNFMFYLLLFYLNSETFYLSSTKRERKVIKELSSGCLFLAFCFLPSHSLAMLILHSVDDFIGTTDFPSFSSFRK